jgi:hypothetical protein
VARRAPVPDDDAQAKAEKEIKETFKQDWARTKTSDKMALAAKLLDSGVQTRDNRAACFLLLREARDLAAQVGDVPTAMKAVDETAVRFEIDAPEAKLAALNKAVELMKPTAGATAKAVVEGALDLLDGALARDQFETALRLTALAEAAARKINGGQALLTYAQARGKEVLALHKEYEAAQAALNVLKEKPGDAEANRVAGHYACFRKGDWGRGLPRLAWGDDAALQALARKDLARPRAAAAQVEVGDGWWELAESQSVPDPALVRRRAAWWYKQALPGLTGLTQARAEKKVAEAQPSPRPPLPDAVGEVHRFTGHTAAVNSVALSPDRRYVLSGGADGAVRLWDTHTGKLAREFAGTGGVIRSVAFSSDGKHALAGGLAGGNGQIRMWEVESGNLASPAVYTAGFDHLVFAGDGRSAWLSGANGLMQKYAVTEGRFQRSTGRQQFGPVRPLAVAQDERMLLFVPQDGKPHLWDVNGQKELPLVWKNPGPVLCGAFAPGTPIMATGGADKIIRLWDLRTGREFRALKGHTEGVTGVAFSADGFKVASASDDGTVRVWYAKTGQQLQLFDWHTDKVLSVAFSADGRRVVSAGSDKTVRVWALPKP